MEYRLRSRQRGLADLGTSSLAPFQRRTLTPEQEWHHQLRSSLHPALFAGFYVVADNAMKLLYVAPELRAVALVAVPKLAQAVFAALGDFYTWKLAESIYGNGSVASWAAVRCPPSRLRDLGLTRWTALDDGAQPLAVVLLHEDVFQLAGDDSHHHGPLPLAMVGAWGFKGKSREDAPGRNERPKVCLPLAPSKPV